MSGESEDLTVFASQALRKPQKTYSLLLTNHLFLSVAAPPLRKIRLICEAAFLIQNEASNLDFELVTAIYETAVGFSSAQFLGSAVYVTWPFSENAENFRRYIQPWLRMKRMEVLASVDDEELAGLEEADDHEYFFCLTRRPLTVKCYRSLLNQFLAWAMPKIMTVFQQLCEYVDPDLYRQLLLGTKTAEGEPGEAPMG